jgi:hypothetical protein
MDTIVRGNDDRRKAQALRMDVRKSGTSRIAPLLDCEAVAGRGGIMREDVLLSLCLIVIPFLSVFLVR